MLYSILLLTVVWATGCEIMPVTRFKPVLNNPFPQILNVAVVPFVNESSNPNVSGSEFANAYINELQQVPGFHVVSLESVKRAMVLNNLEQLEEIDDIRYLAQILKVDAVVIGNVHYFRSSYPQEAKFETKWYAVNPYFHPIPKGYSSLWGTPKEREIPRPMTMEAERELARAQLATQTPEYEPIRRDREEQFDDDLSRPKLTPKSFNREAMQQSRIKLVAGEQGTIPNNLNGYGLDEEDLSGLARQRQQQAADRILATSGVPFVPNAKPVEPNRRLVLPGPVVDPDDPLDQGPWPNDKSKTDMARQNQTPLYQRGQQNPGNYQGHYQGLPYMTPGSPYPPDLTPEQLAQYGWVNQPMMPTPPMYPMMPGMPVEGQPGMVMGEPDRFPGLPKDWPDPRGLIPEGPGSERPVRTEKHDGPFMTATNIYKSNDSWFMQALDDYDFLFRDDKRIAGKQSVLNNRREFISFCCRLQIWEMLTLRGGAMPAEKVTRTWKLWKGGERPY